MTGCSSADLADYSNTPETINLKNSSKRPSHTSGDNANVAQQTAQFSVRSRFVSACITSVCLPFENHLGSFLCVAHSLTWTRLCSSLVVRPFLVQNMYTWIWQLHGCYPFYTLQPMILKASNSDKDDFHHNIANGLRFCNWDFLKPAR